MKPCLACRPLVACRFVDDGIEARRGLPTDEPLDFADARDAAQHVFVAAIGISLIVRHCHNGALGTSYVFDTRGKIEHGYLFRAADIEDISFRFIFSQQTDQSTYAVTDV